MMNLSILICTLPRRRALFEELIEHLQAQQVNGVEILSDAEESISIGAKRQALLEKAVGDYVCFIDDDDSVHGEYIPMILEALRKSPDCVGIVGLMLTDGRHEGLFQHSIRHKAWINDAPGPYRYLRPPNHLNPIKRDIALKAGFNDKSFGEDWDFSLSVYPELSSEQMIDTPIYMYRYSTVKL